MSAQSRQQSKVQALLAERAYALRCNSTRSEQALWQELRANRLGIAFRRQVPIGGKYIADSLAPSIRLVVEVDGGVHQRRHAAPGVTVTCVGLAFACCGWMMRLYCGNCQGRLWQFGWR